MRKKLVILLLLGTLMTAAACSGKDAADVGALSGGLSQAKNTAQPSATPEPQPSATPEPEPSATPEQEPSATPEPEPSATPEQEPTGEITVGDCVISIKMPNNGYRFSCEDDKITFNYHNWKYGVLFPYEVKTWDGLSELDVIIRNFEGASGIVELIDTCEEEYGTRYVLVTRRARYSLGEIEFLAQAGILSEERALEQEETSVVVMYRLNGGRWWCYMTDGDEAGGEGLLDALEFEITFADIK